MSEQRLQELRQRVEREARRLQQDRELLLRELALQPDPQPEQLQRLSELSSRLQDRLEALLA